jgi:hypothetical protein
VPLAVVVALVFAVPAAPQDAPDELQVPSTVDPDDLESDEGSAVPPPPSEDTTAPVAPKDDDEGPSPLDQRRHTAPVDDGGGAGTPPVDDTQVPRPVAAAFAPLDPWLVGCAQAGAGCTTLAVVGLVLSVVLSPLNTFYGSGSFIAFAIASVAAAVVEVMLGDALGAKRGSLLWPALATAAAQFVCGTVGVAALIVSYFFVTYAVVIGVILASSTRLIDPATATTIAAATMLGLGGALFVAIGSAYLTTGAAGAFAYELTAEQKQPGDDGKLQWPGLVKPKHPGKADPPMPRPRPDDHYDDDDTDDHDGQEPEPVVEEVRF